MINIQELEEKIKENKYPDDLADAKCCQDIILLMLSKSKYNHNITIKGGVVMSSLSKNVRRATIDIDFDFIRYPLTVRGIKTFVADINGIEGINIKIVGKIENLKHQDYQGKRIYVEIEDSYKNKLMSKIDIGVHKYFDLTQLNYCFDIASIDEGASLLINSPEQMITEKLKSLIKFGILSTRYKDVYDIYYLLDFANKENLLKAFDILIFADNSIRFETVDDIYNSLNKIFNDKTYLNRLNSSDKNWISIDNNEVFKKILLFLQDIK